MQPQTIGLRQGSKVFDWVEDAVRELWCRADKHHGVWANSSGHCLDVGPIIITNGDAGHLHIKKMGPFVKGWVSAIGDYNLRYTKTALVSATPFAGCLQCHKYTFRAPRRDIASGGIAAIEQAQRPGNDLCLEPL